MSGYRDDAIHIESVVFMGTTLCGQPRHKVYNVIGFNEPRPDGWGGCWTCLEMAQNIEKGLAAWTKGRTK